MYSMNIRRVGVFAAKIGVHKNTVKTWDLNGRPPVVYRDCPCRFGFDGFAYFAETHGCKLRVVNQPGLSACVELVTDLIAVIHTFCCWLSWLRRYKQPIQVAADG